MPLSTPLNFGRWAKDNAHLLQPPVNNFCIHDGGDFTVMAVGGPNERNDYHVNETEVRFPSGARGFMLMSYVCGIGVVLPTQRRHGAACNRRRRVQGCPYRRGRDVPVARCASAVSNGPTAGIGTSAGLLTEDEITANTPHNPVRSENTVGLVIERVRPDAAMGELSGAEC